MRCSKSQDARLVHPLSTSGNHWHQLREFTNIGVQFVPSHLLRPVSHLATVTATGKKSTIRRLHGFIAMQIFDVRK